MKRLFPAIFLVFFPLSGIHASDEIWSALVLATNESPPKAVPGVLEDFYPTIKKVFGYNSLYLLGQKKHPIGSGTEAWLVPSKDFFFQIACLDQDATRYHVRIGLFRDKTLLLTTEAKLARDAPLYIRGPQWGKSLLVLLLDIR